MNDQQLDRAVPLLAAAVLIVVAILLAASAIGWMNAERKLAERQAHAYEVFGGCR